MSTANHTRAAPVLIVGPQQRSVVRRESYTCGGAAIRENQTTEMEEKKTINFRGTHVVI